MRRRRKEEKNKKKIKIDVWMDRRTEKISIRVTRENLFLICFDYRVSIRGVGFTWSCRRAAAGFVLGVDVKREWVCDVKTKLRANRWQTRGQEQRPSCWDVGARPDKCTAYWNENRFLWSLSVSNRLNLKLRNRNWNQYLYSIMLTGIKFYL